MAVIGAGIVGTAVAARLAAAGLEVLVVERAGPAAGASSSGEGNLLVSDKLPGAELSLAKRSLQLWRRLGEQAGSSIELSEKGGLVVAWDEEGLAGLRSLAEAQQAQGATVELLSPEELAYAEPGLSPALVGGAFYPEDCQVQPMLAVAFQARSFRALGGQLLRGAEVLGAQRDAEGVITALFTSMGTISVGKWVVNAAGAWAGELARVLGGDVPVGPRKGHVLVTEPVAELVRYKVYDAGYVGSIHEGAASRGYAAVVESTPAGTMLIGSSREFVGFAGQVDAEAVSGVARRAVALVPGLADVRLMRAYVGFRPATPDRLPVIGADAAVPNLVHATGHEGAGILLSQVTAELVESLLLERDPPLELAPFSAARFASSDLHAGTPASQGRSAGGASRGRGQSVATLRAVSGDGRMVAPPARELVNFTYDGRPLVAPAGTTVAGALLFNGERAWRMTRASGRPRGLFCGIGNCFDCLVDLAGPEGEGHRRAVRACLAPLEQGARVMTSRSVGKASLIVSPPSAPQPSGSGLSGLGLSGSPPPAGSLFEPGASGTGGAGVLEADVAVVGGGPAGMAAAMAAASRGATVVLVDSGARLGGQYFRQALVDLPRAGTGEPGDVSPAGPHLPERWRPLAGHRSVALVLGSDVWSVGKGDERFVLRLAPQGNVGTQANHPGMAYPETVRSHALVLATGASELTLPFPGWELPGVVTAGAAQSLFKSQGLCIGDRVVVAGTGPFLLPVAAGLARAGAAVTAVEAATYRSVPRALPALLGHPAKLAEAAGYASALAHHGVRFLTGRAVVRAAGSLRVERAVTARLGPGWVPEEGTEEVLDADALCVSYGFVPRLELARQLGASETASSQRPAARTAWGDGMVTSVPGLFVAGELAGVAGAEVAELEGELAGHSAASYLGQSDHRSGRERERHARRLGSARAFARRLEPLYPVGQGWLGWLEAGTVFCRCEEVTWGAVREAIGEGAATAREVRNVTRCGMGYCQGRTCGPPLQLALSALSGRSMEETGDLHKRPVAVPVPLGAVIGDH